MHRERLKVARINGNALMPKRIDLSFILPSPPSGGEGKLRVAKQGEGGVDKSSPVFADCVQDHSSDAFRVVENVTVGKADDFVAFAFHESGPGSVVSFSTSMAVAVEFDDQFMAAGGEVGGIARPKDHLPHEFNALQSPASQDRPELRFGRRHFGAELLGACAVGDVSFRQSTAPSPWRRCAPPFPLPLKGVRAVLEPVYA